VSGLFNSIPFHYIVGCCLRSCFNMNMDDKWRPPSDYPIDMWPIGGGEGDVFAEVILSGGYWVLGRFFVECEGNHAVERSCFHRSQFNRSDLSILYLYDTTGLPKTASILLSGKWPCPEGTRYRRAPIDQPTGVVLNTHKYRWTYDFASYVSAYPLIAHRKLLLLVKITA